MENIDKTAVTVTVTVNAPLEKVWQQFNAPEHIVHWNHASDDWHSPFAESEFKEGGKSKITMAAKDGSFSFDFEWVFNKIKEHETVEYTIADGRKVSIQFQPTESGVKVTETFETENTNSVELQREGWQAILNSFKNYVESN